MKILNENIKKGLIKCIEDNSTEDAVNHIFEFIQDYANLKNKENECSC